MTKLKAACIQMRSGLNETTNIAAMSEMVRDAAQRRARYIQTPEMTGLVNRDRKDTLAQMSADPGNPVFAAASELAAELGVWLHVGSTAVLSGQGRAANRGALFSSAGERVAGYDKIHMFDVDLDGGESWRESALYEPGSVATVAEMEGARLGLAICYDLRFGELFRRQAMAGATLLTCPACFTRQTGEAHWHVLLRARAIENGAFMIAAAQGGRHEDGRESFGHSLMIDPWGRVLGELDHDRPDVLVCELDLAQPALCRAKIPNLRNVRDFTVRIASGAVADARGAA